MAGTENFSVFIELDFVWILLSDLFVLSLKIEHIILGKRRDFIMINVIEYQRRNVYSEFPVHSKENPRKLVNLKGRNFIFVA